jgi:hypothetical protein
VCVVYWVAVGATMAGTRWWTATTATQSLVSASLPGGLVPQVHSARGAELHGLSQRGRVRGFSIFADGVGFD